MGMFAFRRIKEQEAAKQVASTPVVKPKRKRKPKVTKNGDNDQRDLSIERS